MSTSVYLLLPYIITFPNRFHCANYFIERWLKPMQTRKMDEKKVEGALKGMEKCLGEIETVWLANGEKQFLAGDSISVRRHDVEMSEILCLC